MYNQPFYIPGYFGSTMPNMATNMTRGALASNRALNGMSVASRGSLFGKLGNTFGALKAFDWGGLINNTSKTLGIINQTIPLVKQVGPMVGNVRSMIKVASIFKDETDNNNINTKNIKNSPKNIHNKQQSNNQTATKKNKEKEEKFITTSNSDSPTFFI